MLMDWKNVTKSILPKAIYRLNAIPKKTPMVFFGSVEQIFLTLYGNTKDPK